MAGRRQTAARDGSMSDRMNDRSRSSDLDELISVDRIERLPIWSCYRSEIPSKGKGWCVSLARAPWAISARKRESFSCTGRSLGNWLSVGRILTICRVFLTVFGCCEAVES